MNKLLSNSYKNIISIKFLVSNTINHQLTIHIKCLYPNSPNYNNTLIIQILTQMQS